MIGIYKINCITNNKNYIGSSTNIEKRWYRHKLSLKNNKHINKMLQSAWNKYGEINFKFEVIEEMSIFNESYLLEKEQKWMDFYKSYDRMKGFNQSEIAKTFIPCKEYIVTDPSGKSFIVKNLEKFCREHGFALNGLHNVASGQANQYKQWKCRHSYQTEEEWEKNKKRNYKSGTRNSRYIFTKKDGTQVFIKNLRQFCLENKYSAGTLHGLIKNKRKSAYGFIKIKVF